jgi:hypothetical protein
MEKNVGGFDRVWRFAASGVLLLAGIFAPVGMAVKGVLFFFAAATFLTGFFSW